MATIAPGSSAYLAMTTMATLVNQALDDVNIQVDATGAATKHMIELAEGKLDMCMTSPTVYKFMRTGTVMYKELADAPEARGEHPAGVLVPAGPVPHRDLCRFRHHEAGRHQGQTGLPRPARRRRLGGGQELGARS